MGVTLTRLVGFNTRGTIKFVRKVRGLAPKRRKEQWRLILAKMDVRLRASMGLPPNASEPMSHVPAPRQTRGEMPRA